MDPYIYFITNDRKHGHFQRTIIKKSIYTKKRNYSFTSMNIAERQEEYLLFRIEKAEHFLQSQLIFSIT